MSDTAEPANVVYGRLLESAHISGYSFERTCAELEWLLEDGRWRSVGTGYDDINAFARSVDLSAFNMDAAPRRALARRLAELDASQRATAKMLGVHHSTVQDDLRGGNPPRIAESEPADLNGRDSGGGNPPPEWFERHPSEVVESAKSAAQREAARGEAPPVETPPWPEAGRYRCIVIDPPWPMRKIERDVRPKQGQALDYPPIPIDEMAEIPVRSFAAEDGAHIYLWVTHRFLPDGLRLLEAWGARYECALVWCKNVGVTPFSWMYDVELALFAHFGEALPLLSRGLRLRVDGLVTEHSSKPDAFYERVRTASPGPRLDMYARGAHEGFEPWGAEAEVAG